MAMMHRPPNIVRNTLKSGAEQERGDRGRYRRLPVPMGPERHLFLARTYPRLYTTCVVNMLYYHDFPENVADPLNVSDGVLFRAMVGSAETLANSRLTLSSSSHRVCRIHRHRYGLLYVAAMRSRVLELAGQGGMA